MARTSSSNARERLVATTRELLRRQGYHATGLNQIVEESQAPKGSLYHYFPGGKEELAVEAVHQAQAELEQEIRMAIGGSHDARQALELMTQAITQRLKESNFQEACPISTVALETAATCSGLQQACSSAYHSMARLITQGLTDEGYSGEEAAELANLMLCVYLGGLLLSRTHLDTRPVEQAVGSLLKLLPQPGARRKRPASEQHVD